MLTVSIITINYNSSTCIQRTIDSILSQSDTNIEWIVVDGGSIDESRSILEKNKLHFNHFISEPDRGVAHAMNKGLSLCSGEVVIYMNSGDTFYSNISLSEAISLWDYEKYDWITGSASVFHENGKKLYDRFHNKANWKTLLMNGCKIFHASTLIKTTVLREVGGFSEHYKSSMDYDLWLRLIKRNRYPQIINPLISIFFVGGISSNLKRRSKEDRKSRIENGFNSPWREIWLGAVANLKIAFHSLKKFTLIYKIKEFLRI